MTNPRNSDATDEQIARLLPSEIRFLSALAMAAPGVVTDRMLFAAAMGARACKKQSGSTLRARPHSLRKKFGHCFGVVRVPGLGYRMMQADAARFLEIYGAE